jgi:hypothetical protein
LRLFLVDRIEQVTVLEERFEIPEDFSAGDLTGSAFGLIDEQQQTIKVRFGAEIGHLIRERIWHPSQELVEEDDGTRLSASKPVVKRRSWRGFILICLTCRFLSLRGCGRFFTRVCGAVYL